MLFRSLKNIVFMCRNTAQVDDSLAFDGCCAILRFYGLRGVGKDKRYLCEFVFVSISKNIISMCRNKAQVDDSLAFDGCRVISTLSAPTWSLAIVVVIYNIFRSLSYNTNL